MKQRPREASYPKHFLSGPKAAEISKFEARKAKGYKSTKQPTNPNDRVVSPEGMIAETHRSIISKAQLNWTINN